MHKLFKTILRVILFLIPKFTKIFKNRLHRCFSRGRCGSIQFFSLPVLQGIGEEKGGRGGGEKKYTYQMCFILIARNYVQEHINKEFKTVKLKKKIGCFSHCKMSKTLMESLGEREKATAPFQSSSNRDCSKASPPRLQHWMLIFR